jgi:peptide/nickel transport system substrate-binding protein
VKLERVHLTGRRPVVAWTVLALSLLLACSPQPTPSGSAPAAQQSEPAPARTLIAAVRNEPPGLAPLAVPAQSSGIALYFTKRMFNADLAILDGDGIPQPYLAESLPQLNSESWQVFPDSRMETTYRLKPNLTWHDGSPLTSDDFAFAFQVLSTPSAGYTSLAPINQIEAISTPDPRTIVIAWKGLYAQAGALQSIGTGATGLPALPKAILGPVFAEGSIEALANNPYWNRSYVGLGPYRLVDWQQGSYLEAAAFPQHVGGAPKIQKITVRFIPDGNTALASMLSGDVQLATDVALPLGYVPEVLNRWGPGHGSAVLHPNQWRSASFQLRPDFASPQALLDVRVRRALAHTVDKDAINAAAWAGQAINSDIMISPTSAAGRQVDAAITKYPLDPRQSEVLMTSAGFTRGADGTYTSPTGGRFATTLNTNASPNNEAEMSIVAAGWRQYGFDVQESVLPAPLARDNEARAAFPGLFIANTNVGEQIVLTLTTGNIPRADNRWTGTNRGGYSNPDYDRLVDQLAITLERNQRTEILAQMAKIFSDDEPAISFHFQPQPWVFPSSVTGPKLVASETNMAWSMVDWEYR